MTPGVSTSCQRGVRRYPGWRGLVCGNLGLAEWARLLAGQLGLSFELSSAGRRAETLRQLWDAREDFVASMTGQLLPVLRAFQPSHAQSSVAYPGDEGVVLLNGVREGYLTFAGMVKLAGEGVSVGALRDGVDALAARGVVRRGLVLGCGLCGRPSFIAIGNLAQVNQCSRCGAANDLAQKQWRYPVEEPSWFYDLHPVARELLADHGEVPLLLSRHLRSTSRRYDDVPELELRDASGNPVAEADLIAVCDDDVIVAEAKSNDALGGNAKEIRRAAAKRVRLADVLRADQIILATTRTGMERLKHHGNPQRSHRTHMASRTSADDPPHNRPRRRPGRGSAARSCLRNHRQMELAGSVLDQVLLQIDQLQQDVHDEVTTNAIASLMRVGPLISALTVACGRI